jgi:large subunit ribosomal protein L18
MAGSASRPRLAVFRSGKHIYAQAVDDGAGHTLACASSLDGEIKGRIAKGGGLDAAKAVGAAIAAKLKGKGIGEVVFDRGGFLFHGRVKALAEAARESGLKF